MAPRKKEFLLKDFNPRTREGCDGQQFARLQGIGFISIHAPVKGATVLVGCGQVAQDISIHAPVKGATFGMIIKPFRVSEFQSTHP